MTKACSNRQDCSQRADDLSGHRIISNQNNSKVDAKTRIYSQNTNKEVFSRDTNNNDDSPASDPQHFQAFSKCELDNNGNYHDNEEWQILEAETFKSKTESDDDRKMGQSDNKNNVESVSSDEYADAFGRSLTKRVDGEQAIDKKYIEVDPLGLGKEEKFSPILVYLCTAIYSLLPVASTFALFSLIYLLFTRYYFVSLVYFSYIFWDRNTCNKGGRRLDIVHKSKFWSYLAAYFPIKLRYSTQFRLHPDKNYILNYHPHGISAFGAVTAFATNGLNFSKLFPGITARFMVHETSFVVPVMKETFGLRGDCSVNSKSIDYMLSKRSTGNLLTIVVGGLAEADMSESEVLRTVIVERKGFVKKALINGANIIPCIAFGENSVFHKVNLPRGSFFHRLQTGWYNLFKFKHPIYYGKGILLQKFKGLMPFKNPITVVMGDPIIVEQKINPTQRDIDELHAVYLRQLKSVYESNDDLRVKYDKKLELY